ncbi:hypothetical protein F5Y05DRAFT_391332 [Hypoxylon sp. FL0543]|nr:hypothetical protein F5Y05DRAFT_391332 [Hypoxylon sp. FL0543]
MPQPAPRNIYASGFSPEEEDREDRVKEQLVMKLRDHGILPDKELAQFKYDVAVLFERARGCQNAQEPLSRLQQYEIEGRFIMIPHFHLLYAVVEHIEKRVPKSRCIQVYEDVMSVLPRNESRAISNKFNPRRIPRTPFSVSKAAPESIKFNAQLIDALVSTANLHRGTATMLRGYIVWSDSYPRGTNGSPGILDTKSKLVNGGRLGRDHMLSDVPNNFVRDSLMYYINTELREEQRKNAKRAVFSDLSPTEIQQYSTLIMKEPEEDGPRTKKEMIAKIVGDRYIMTGHERAEVLEQAMALEEVETDIDLTPKPGFAIRLDNSPPPISRSVVVPGRINATPEELRIEPGTDIDRDCHQIRAMIAIFIKRTKWTADQFRLALPGARRPDLTTFLQEDGDAPWEGDYWLVALAWEFFKRRELLGLPLADTSTSEDGGVLQERDANTRKRPSDGDHEAEAMRKRPRRGWPYGQPRKILRRP